MVYHFTRRCAASLCTALALATLVAAPARSDANPLVALIDAATSRLQTAEPVAAIKWINGGSIEDPPRVVQVLAGVASDATKRGIDSGYVRRVFTDQIDATTGIEYTRFGQWKLDPASAPGVAPDLTASLQWPVLHSPECGRLLDDASTAVADAAA